MFQMREMPRTMASLPYYQSTQDLEGKISTVSLPAELPVAQANAVPVTQFRLPMQHMKFSQSRLNLFLQ
jgi:hypothetical protein